MGFSFGDINLGGSIGIMATSGTGADTTPAYVTYAEFTTTFNQVYADLNSLTDFMNGLVDYLNQGVVPKWHVTQQMIIPVI